MSDAAATISDLPDEAFASETEESEVETDDSSGSDEVEAEASDKAEDFSDDSTAEEEPEEEVEAKDTSEEEEEKKPAPKAVGNRAEQRIRNLIKSNKETEARLQEFTQREASIQRNVEQFVQQQRQQQHELTKQNAVLMRELEIIKNQHELKEEENLDPAEKLIRKMRREALSDAEQKIGSEVQKVKQQYDSLVQDMQKREQAAARQQRIFGYAQQTDMEVNKLLNGIDKDVAESIREDVKTWVLNAAAASGIDIPDSAREWDRIAHKYVLAKAKLRSKASGEKMQKGKKIPQAASSSVPAKGKGRLSYQQSVKAGFKDSLDAMISRSFGRS